tara:strand:+ start:9301 stop:10473 length:1173 start_codon:yes stop_codon:yes gene_type:complete
MKKVLVITSNILPVPAVNGGATEKLVELLIDENEKHKQICFEVISRYDVNASEIAKWYSDTKIHYYYNQLKLKYIFNQLGINLKYAFKRLIGITTLTRYQYFILQVISKTKFDFVLVEGGRYEHYVFLKDLKYNTKIIAHVHRNVNTNDLALKKYDHIIAVSEHIKRNIVEELGYDNTDVLLNCCDEKKFISSTAFVSKCKRNSSYFTILYVGRLISEKGVLELFDAVHSLNNSNIRVKVSGESLYKNSGKSKYSEYLHKHELCMEGLVEFLGYVDNSKLQDIMRSCDLCVVPSQFNEPLSLVPLEAMNAGLPVVLSDAGGLPEWCVEGYPKLARLGRLFTSELSSHIEFYFYSEAERIAAIQQGLKIAKKHTSENYYNKFISIVNSYEN